MAMYKKRVKIKYCDNCNKFFVSVKKNYCPVCKEMFVSLVKVSVYKAYEADRVFNVSLDVPNKSIMRLNYINADLRSNVLAIRGFE